MPNCRSVQLNTAAGDLIVVTRPNGTGITVTGAEAQAWVDGHPGITDAQMEAQVVTWLQTRWTDRTDNLAVHLVRRSPLVVLLWLSSGPVPAQWWL